MKQLIVKGPDAIKIAERLAKDYPGITVEEFITKYDRDTLVLE